MIHRRNANINPRQVVPHEVPKWEPILAEAYIVERATATNQQSDVSSLPVL